MKKRVGFILLVVVLISYCSGSYSPPFGSDSGVYSLFKTMADSLDMKVLDPDKPVKLITTNTITVYTTDIMPELYQQFGQFKDDVKVMADNEAYIISMIKVITIKKAEDRLLVKMALEKDISVSEDSLNVNMEKLFKNFGGKDKYFALIDTMGLARDYVKNNIKNGLLKNSFIEQCLLTEGLVEEAELKQFYSQDKTATVRHILFMIQGKTVDEKRQILKKARRVLAMARSGYDFAKLANKYSEDPGSNKNGGIYQDFEPGQMVLPFDRASFTRPVGEVGDIVETQYGYHILKVIERKKEERPFEEVKEELMDKLLKQKEANVLYVMLNYFKNESGYEEHFEVLENL